ncbi:MAG: DUF61 family protein [Dehalococcoidia bacterium]|nr:MAG: DUF61 family protein [Dehalococcoidia bacterium]TEU18260.1 MAG: DUF61 family protein [Dehalococcoidia bacterium]
MPEPLQNEAKQSPYEKMLQDCLRGELRVVNTGLPQSQKRQSKENKLFYLLNEKYPHVVCNDGSTHFFKKSELEYLASMLDTDEQETLPLPMLIELGANQAEAAIICEGKVEEKVISKALNMPVTCEERRIRIYKPQLALLRRKFKTTTVYVFSPKIVA